MLKAFTLEAMQASRAALGPLVGCGVQAEQRASQQTESSFHWPTLPREQRPVTIDAMMQCSSMDSVAVCATNQNAEEEQANKAVTLARRCANRGAYPINVGFRRS